MRHIEIDGWARSQSLLHELDARSKLVTVLLVLGFAGTARPWTLRHVVFYAALAAVAVAAAKLSWLGLARRLAIILPFPLLFAWLSWFSTGDTAHAASLISRSSISASFVVILMGVTPAPAVLDAAARLGVPRLLVSVSQFLYRYLFLLFEQALRVKQAAACRGGFRWSAAAGAAGALFASSEGRAERIHHSMQARGYRGSFPALDPPVWRTNDTLLVASVPALLLVARMLWQF